MADGYPDDWDQRRKKVYRRDGYECQRCGASGGMGGNAELHAHHKTPKSEGGSHSLSNLQTLCRDCHSQVHGHPVGGGASSSKKYDIDWNEHPILDVSFKWFVAYIFGAVAVMPLTMGIGLFSWIVCSLVVAVLTYGGRYSKGAFYYTLYGILLCIVTPYMLSYVGINVSYSILGQPPSIVMWTPVVMLIITNLIDFTFSQVLEGHSHVSTRLT